MTGILRIEAQHLEEIVRPVLAVFRTHRTYAESACRFHIAWSVVEEQRFSRQDLLFVEHHLEETWVRLHNAHLITEVNAIEIVFHGVSLSVEIGTGGPVHHKWICIRQQDEPVSLLPQPHKGIEIALWQFLAVSQPRIEAFVEGELPMAKEAQLIDKLIGADSPQFELSEDTALRIGVEALRCIIQSQQAEFLHCLGMVERDNDSTKVKDNRLDVCARLPL